MKREYNEKDLQNKNWAIISFDWEDGAYLIESTHIEKEMAEKRHKYLKKEEQRFMTKPQGYAIDYYLVDINDKRIRNCFNYNCE